MKKPSITTGEWIPSEEGTTGEIWIDAVTSGESDEICQVSQASITKDEATANAQAIAALPKLLEALENALEEAENFEESLEGLIGLKNYILNIVPPALIAAGYTE